jgi:spermidine/putrescine transport system permease protein
VTTASAGAPPAQSTSESSGAAPAASRPRFGARTWGRLRTGALALWSGLALLYLFLPIFIVVLFSFNDPKGRFNYTWQGFTLDHWKDPFGVEGLGQAVSNSLQIAAISTVIALILGTGMALALVRHRFHGRGAADMFTFLPLASPEVVLGAALLALFLTMNVATGFVTIVIAHVMFNVSYVVVTVKARLEGMDRHIEEAAMDLGANDFTTFRKVTLPMILPGLAAAGLLAFVLSLDDFVITNFNAGETQTFPLFIWGAARQGVPAQVNVIATALLLGALLLMALNLLVQRRRAVVALRAG